jgi:tricarballylate dehydrogenase
MYPPLEAPTLEQLAELIAVPPVVLGATIESYNAAVKRGSPLRDDSQIGDEELKTTGLRPAKSKWASPIERPPFRAYPLRPGITFTYLGLEIDERAGVAADGGAFSNVFAAGEAVAGNILLRGYLAGVGMTIGTVFGRRAGASAYAAV